MQNRRRHTLTRLTGCTLAWFCTLSCGGERSAEGPVTLVIAASADPDALFPPSALNVEARQATELIYDYLADVGVGMNTIGDSGFVKQLASAWSWARDSSFISFTLDPRARWHDGPKVTSADVSFSFDVYTDERVGSMLVQPLSGIDSVTTPDSATAVFWFAKRNPRQFFTAAAMMLILPRHLLDSIPRDALRKNTAARYPVGSGRYRFSRWTHGSALELAAVKDHFRGTPKVDRLLWTIVPEYRAGIMRLRAGEIDVFANVRQETIPDLVGEGKFNIVTLPGMDYVFLQFNLRDSTGSAPHRLFSSRELRRAITMALDREKIVKNLFDTLASVSIGPAVRAFPTTDTSLVQIPFDRTQAARILDSLGWTFPASPARAEGIRIRRRNGIPLRFRLLVPVSSLSRMRLSVLLQEQLRQTGIDVVVEEMDYSTFSARQASRTFDAALASWHLGSSPEAVRATWTSDAAEKGGLNYGSYTNAVFDQLVDSALSASSLAASREYFRRANQVIVNDAAAIWLYEPKAVLAINRRVNSGPMRPNAWWLGIADWWLR